MFTRECGATADSAVPRKAS